MGPRTVSVSTVLFDGHPMGRAFDLIAAAGAAHVEPAFIRGYVDFAEPDLSPASGVTLRRRAGDAGLAVHAISAHLDLSGDDAGAGLARRIAFAEACGARILITNAGPAARRDRIEAALEAALPLCERAGIVLALENPGHGSGDLLGTGPDGLRLVREIGSPHLRLNHDVANVATYTRGEVRPVEDLAAALDAVAHVHLKGVAEEDWGWRFCPLGEGIVDVAAVMAALPDHLPISLELPLRLSRPGKSEPTRASEPIPVEQLAAALGRSLDVVTTVDKTSSSRV